MSTARLAMPLWLAAAGTLSSLVGFFFVSTKEKGDGWNTNLGSLMWALEKGMYIANGIFLALAAVIVILLFGPNSVAGWKMYGCVVIGLVTGMIIGKCTEYFTSFDYGPTISIKDRARTGPATVIIQVVFDRLGSSLMWPQDGRGCVTTCISPHLGDFLDTKCYVDMLLPTHDGDPEMAGFRAPY